MPRLLSIILLATFISACGTPPDAGTELRVDDAWVRAMPDGSDRTAVYFSITNPSDTERRMTAARTERAGTTELHVTTIEDDVMRMRHVEAYDIAPGETFCLEPGGPHIMLLDVEEQLVEGDSVSIVLVFDLEDEVEIVAEVRAG